MENSRGLRKTRVGEVISNKMDKSISVAVVRRVKHSVYKKYIKRTMKLMAHDEKNDCNEGDLVKIMETRPLSHSKRWRLVEILERKK
jgi:small subunit ribosomal protein S17